MFRRVVSLALLPCLLLSPTAALGHTHGEGKPNGHDQRPHVHTNPVAVDSPDAHGHRHRHGPDGHHHHHDDVADTPEPDTQPTQPPEQPKDHDTDAVYLTATDAVVVERSETTTQGESSDWLTICDLDPFAAYRATPPACPVVCGHPPPGQFCPLYIRHLALLI